MEILRRDTWDVIHAPQAQIQFVNPSQYTLLVWARTAITPTRINAFGPVTKTFYVGMLDSQTKAWDGQVNLQQIGDQTYGAIEAKTPGSHQIIVLSDDRFAIGVYAPSNPDVRPREDPPIPTIDDAEDAKITNEYRLQSLESDEHQRNMQEQMFVNRLAQAQHQNQVMRRGSLGGGDMGREGAIIIDETPH